MKKKLIIIIAAIAIVLLIAAIAVYMIFFRKDNTIRYPEGTIGNTAGNLNNGGLFCEKDGVVYFSNARDGGFLYAMNPDESNKRKILSNNVMNLLVAGNHIYYSQLSSSSSDAGLGYVRGMHSLNRCDLNGKKGTNISFDLIIHAQLVNDTLYILTTDEKNITFYKQNVNKKEPATLAEYEINPSCIVNNTIFYSDNLDNHALMRLDTTEDISELVYRGTVWNPCYYDGYFYFMDPSRDYALCRYSMEKDIMQILTEDRVDCFNVGSGYIYYQCISRSGNCLKMMKIDGSDVQTITLGNFCNINMTSEYVYFQDFGVVGSLYHVPIGSTAYEPFN